jgi:hypothetical protein
MIKLIWLIASLTGAPLGVFVFPEPVTVDYCASRVTATEFVGDEEKIAGAISDGTKQDISITPTCLTEPEVDDLLKKLKTQGPSEEDTPAILIRDARHHIHGEWHHCILLRRPGGCVTP